MKSRKKKTVLVYGDFNILHPGHIRFLRFASEQGNRLIVGLLSKSISTGADLPDDVRLEAIRSLGCVTESIIVTDSISDLILRTQPDVIVKGKEHEGKPAQELSLIRELGIKLIFSSGSMGHSESELSYRYKNNHPLELGKLSDFLERKKITYSDLYDLVGRFKALKVCVVGDLIVDEYISCEALGMSQEDPTIVVTPVESTKFLGGAGIVAAHAAALGAEVTLLSVTGKDAAGKFAHERLDEYGVHYICPEDPGRPTTVKQRYRCDGKTVFRISHLREDSISLEIQSAILQYLSRLSHQTDLLIFSDFNYGVVTLDLIQAACNLKWKEGAVQVADSQTSSQLGDITKFQNMTAVYATEHESRTSLRDKDSGLVVLGTRLLERTNSTHIFLKLGPDGLLTLSRPTEKPEKPDLVPSVARSPVDTAGAGDSLLVASALTIAAGGSSWHAAAIGAVAAGIQVSRLGNTPITFNSIIANFLKAE